MKRLLWLLILWWPGCATLQAQPVMLSGNLNSAGSDTLGHLMTLWAEDFTREAPGVNVQVQAAGSSTAAVALAAGAAQLGPMSRRMLPEEEQRFIARYGYPPLAIPVAMDALVMVVSQDNPLRQLRVGDPDALFSVTHLCGAGRRARLWGDLGLTQPEWRSRPIQLSGRNSASGTWAFLRQQALCGGDYRSNVAEYPGSAAVMLSVAGSRNAIGYASYGVHLSGVRMLALTRDDGSVVAPTPQTLRDGRYPWVRSLWIYINKPPGKPLSPLVSAFMHSILSAQGQQRVSEAGYLPLSAGQLGAAKAALGQ